MAFQKPPPPPPIATKDPTLNRWFLAVTAFLKNNGTIDPNAVQGLPELTAEVATLQGQVTTLQGQVATLNGQVTTLQGQVATLNGQVTTLQGQVTALQARAQVFNGVVPPAPGLGGNGDWYANTAGGVGARIYVKVAGAWVAFPF